MLDRDLQKHSGEFRRYLRNNQFEQTPEGGILFPKASALATGGYIHDVNGQDERFDPNLLPNQGLMYMLGVSVHTTTKITAWYLALYAADYTPLAGLTAATFPATASEITSNTEGYTGATRPAWTSAAPSANMVDNLATKAVYTIATASSLAVNGAAVVSDSTKGAVVGTLLSATKFAATRTLYNTDVFNLAYRISLAST